MINIDLPSRLAANRSRRLAACLATIVVSFSFGTARAETRRELIDRTIEQRLAGGPEGMVLTVWAGFASGRELYSRDPQRAMPVASAIKAAILVEFYARYEGGLDAHPEGVGTVFDDGHPAFTHYRKSSRSDARETLSRSTVDEIGRIMIGATEAPNLTYNGAANVAIALLGGPEAATRSFRSRDREWNGLILNRYMLADRTERGDNTATAAALAAVHRRLASRGVPGLRTETVDRARAVLAKGKRKLQLFSKGGSLSSEPLTRVRAGWREGPRRSLVWVVMGSAPKPKQEAEGSGSAYEQLTADVRAVWDTIDEAYSQSL